MKCAERDYRLLKGFEERIVPKYRKARCFPLKHIGATKVAKNDLNSFKIVLDIPIRFS